MCAAVVLISTVKSRSPPLCGMVMDQGCRGSAFQSIAGLFFCGITHAYVRAKLLWRRLGEVLTSLWVKNHPGGGLLLGMGTGYDGGGHGGLAAPVIAELWLCPLQILAVSY